MGVGVGVGVVQGLGGVDTLGRATVGHASKVQVSLVCCRRLGAGGCRNDLCHPWSMARCGGPWRGGGGGGGDQQDTNAMPCRCAGGRPRTNATTATCRSLYTPS